MSIYYDSKSPAGQSYKNIICPICRNDLSLRKEYLICDTCRKQFPIQEGIVDLYVDQTMNNLSKTVEEANVSHYDRNVEKFKSNVIRPSDAFYKYERDTLSELSGDRKGRILDIGTGTGKIIELAAPFYHELYGIDVSIEMLFSAKKITPYVYRASALLLPFKDDFFNVVTAHSVLHHIIDLEKAMQEVYRTLKSGGVFYSDTDANQMFVKHFGWFLEMRRKLKKRLFEGDEEIERLSDYFHYTGLDPKHVEKTLYSAGFNHVEIRYHFPPNPDEFTKLLMELDSYHKDIAHYYYFAVIAKKN